MDIMERLLNIGTTVREFIERALLHSLRTTVFYSLNFISINPMPAFGRRATTENAKETLLQICS